MVQFLKAHPKATSAENYWMPEEIHDRGRTSIGNFVQCSALHNHGLRFPHHAPPARLEKMFERGQRGLLIYDNCDTWELRGFCVTRLLVVARLAHRNREELIAFLENEDEKAEFQYVWTSKLCQSMDLTSSSLFEDLLPELRIQIYAHYTKSLEREHYGSPRNRIAAEPPITKVSRLLRREALPVFYNVFEFAVAVPNLLDDTKDAAALFFERAPVSVMERIGKLRVHGFVVRPGHDYKVYPFKFKLGDGQDALRVKQIDAKYVEEWPSHVQEKMQVRVQDLDIQGKEDNLRLQRGDLDKLLAISRNI
ncbi:Hypothetical predicted protein [Lecanosticta acicola]|uniref:Uncharacterized protein n=1 Tax=Lecanosticta acicola TaxID=111012 RepID=A0AAI8YTX5_9PEZI|nr:Hypothetical predicted protein [Lecanosticta acicola]